jgi:hypothetical protein
MRQVNVAVRTITARFRSDEIADFFFELRQQTTYPIVQGDPLLLLYDLLCVMNVPEQQIAEWLGPRGYMHIARHRFVQPAAFESALQQVLEVNDEEAAGE